MRSLFGRVDPFRPVARQHTRSVSVSLCGLGLTAGLMIIWVIVQALGPGVTTGASCRNRRLGVRRGGDGLHAAACAGSFAAIHAIPQSQ